jgi:hypothetical protein
MLECGLKICSNCGMTLFILFLVTLPFFAYLLFILGSVLWTELCRQTGGCILLSVEKKKKKTTQNFFRFVIFYFLFFLQSKVYSHQSARRAEPKINRSL